MPKKNQRRNQSRRAPSRNNGSNIISNQPPPYTPDKILEYRIRYVPITANYFWTLPVSQQSPFGWSSSTVNIYNLAKFVRMKHIRMTLLYDPDESLDNNWISLKFNQSAGQNGVVGTEQVRYASQAMPGVISIELDPTDPRGYWYDVVNSSGNPTISMQTRKNCFIDITWEIILYDGASDTNVTSGVASNLLYTNSFTTDMSCPGRQTAVW